MPAQLLRPCICNYTYLKNKKYIENNAKVRHNITDKCYAGTFIMNGLKKTYKLLMIVCVAFVFCFFSQKSFSTEKKVLKKKSDCQKLKKFYKPTIDFQVPKEKQLHHEVKKINSNFGIELEQRRTSVFVSWDRQVTTQTCIPISEAFMPNVDIYTSNTRNQQGELISHTVGLGVAF